MGYSDSELANMGGYDLVHYDDLAYVASAHQECKIHIQILKINQYTTNDNSKYFSIENWCFRNDRLPLPDQRGSMAMVTDFFQIGV